MSVEVLLNQLDKVKSTGTGKWLACCPAHDDSDPSMSVREVQDGRILIHCFAGCSPAEIMASVGLSMADLYPEGAINHKLSSLLPKEHKNAEDRYKDRVYLQIAFEKRSRGERLTAHEIKLEREAFIRVKSA
ncbi:MAG: virulence-associated protein E [Candidatus Thiodiazotropha sp. (ex Troendleina suluensis)]|nr:virulence-associated protein E [Candidatus Thiodiazotropha sp. (ex Troendleina suluensis)]